MGGVGVKDVSSELLRGVTRAEDAGPAAIRHAYRTLVRRFHPDTGIFLMPCGDGENLLIPPSFYLRVDFRFSLLKILRLLTESGVPPAHPGRQSQFDIEGSPSKKPLRVSRQSTRGEESG